LLSIYDIFEFAAVPRDPLPRGRAGGQRSSLPCFSNWKHMPLDLNPATTKRCQSRRELPEVALVL